MYETTKLYIGVHLFFSVSCIIGDLVGRFGSWRRRWVTRNDVGLDDFSRCSLDRHDTISRANLHYGVLNRASKPESSIFFLKKTRIVHGLIIRTSFLLKKWTTRLWLIRVKLLDNPYPSDFFNTISYSESAWNWIRIIHIHVGNKNYSPYPLISYSDRIRAGNYPHHFILITTSNRNPLSVQAGLCRCTRLYLSLIPSLLLLLVAKCFRCNKPLCNSDSWRWSSHLDDHARPYVVFFFCF